MTTQLAASAVVEGLKAPLADYANNLSTLQGAQESLTKELTALLQKTEAEAAAIGEGKDGALSTADLKAATSHLESLLKRQAAVRSSLAASEKRLLRLQESLPASAPSSAGSS